MKVMDDLLNNPPKIRKNLEKKAQESKEDGVMLLEKTDSSLLGKKKRWKYFISNAYGQEEGFARSRRGALLKIKWWTIRQEAGARKKARKDITSLNAQEFLALAGEEFPLRDYQEKTLKGQKMGENLLLFSAQSSRPLLRPRDNWVAGTVHLKADSKNHTKTLVTEARNRQRAEKEVLKTIKKELAREELEALKSSVKEG